MLSPFARRLIVSALVAIVAPAAKAGPSSKDVVVTNDAANPVPVVVLGTAAVTGAVAITNTPSVNVSNTPSVIVSNTPSVTVSNTPSVTVSNTPSVTVSNTPSVTVSNQPTVKLAAGSTVEITPAQPFVARTVVNVVLGDVIGTASIDLPASQRFVVEYVAVRCRSGLGQKMEVQFQAQTNGVTGNYTIPVQYQGSTAGLDTNFGSQLVKVYADPASQLTMDIHRHGSPALDGTANCDYSFSGYLVNGP
jgi:hypothetical protein